MVEVILGDGRLSLERELALNRRQDFDVLAVDAFSSDAVPVHLLTREAMSYYLQHLRQPDGILAFQITNRYLNLRPVVIGLASTSAFTIASSNVRTPEIWPGRTLGFSCLPTIDSSTLPTVRTACLLSPRRSSNSPLDRRFQQSV